MKLIVHDSFRALGSGCIAVKTLHWKVVGEEQTGGNNSIGLVLLVWRSLNIIAGLSNHSNIHFGPWHVLLNVITELSNVTGPLRQYQRQQVVEWDSFQFRLAGVLEPKAVWNSHCELPLNQSANESSIVIKIIETCFDWVHWTESNRLDEELDKKIKN